jgi:UDP-glucose 4-epimerase
VSRPAIVVAGGAGYIGSHMVRMLAEEGWLPVVVDNLATGHADAVARDAILRDVEIGDGAAMRALLREFQPECVKQFIFSSTAAVYGNPIEVPITEQHPQAPINPYGNSKLAVEQALQDYSRAYGLRSISLRYFNAAGAHPDGTLGERHDPETHLIPLVLQVASGRREFIARFGSNFPTRDGSCIRDYIHVQDLCAAHLLAMRALAGGAQTTVYNLGNGNGQSVNEVIDAARRATGHPIPVRDDPPRAGDPPVLVADASRARAELGWVPRHPDIETIIAHAWNFERRHQVR